MKFKNKRATRIERMKNTNDFDPTLHIIPLNEEKSPIILTFDSGDNSDSLVAITDNGRISYIPLDYEIVYLDKDRIGRTHPFVSRIMKQFEDRYPNNKDDQGKDLKQYIVVCVMYGEQGKEAKLIYDILASSDYSNNLAVIYSTLESIQGTVVGGKDYNNIQRFLQRSDVSLWINNFIISLKEQLDWSNYVRRALDND